MNTYGVFNGGGGIFSGVSGSTVDAVVAGFNRAVAPDVVSVLQSSVIKGTITEGMSVSALSSLSVDTVDCFAYYNHGYVDLCNADCRDQVLRWRKRKKRWRHC